MLKIKVLPAGCGDCLLVSFGQCNDIKNILIDSGIGATYKKFKPEIELIKYIEVIGENLLNLGKTIQNLYTQKFITNIKFLEVYLLKNNFKYMDYRK